MRLKEYKEPWKETLHGIKSRIKDTRKPNHRKICCLITAEELKILWFRDKSYLMEKPTIDRKDNKGNYTFQNCQYLEHKINSGKKLINLAMRKNWSKKSKLMWKKESVRKRISQSAKNQMLKQWQDPAWRDRMSLKFKEATKHRKRKNGTFCK